MTVRIVQPTTPERWRAARQLVREYAASLGLDLSFQDFEREMADLETEYGPPRGTFLIAVEAGTAIACVGLRPLTPPDGEIKRLYVIPGARGRGVGRLLAAKAVERAREMGYGRLLLDTLPTMIQARSLYASLGFVPVPPYRFNPVPGTAFMQLELGERPRESHLAPDAINIVENDTRYLSDFIRLNEIWISEHFRIEEADRKLARDPGVVIRNGGYIFTALLDHQAVGVASLFYTSPSEFELARMAVAPTHRDRGIGRALMNVALWRAKEVGAARVFLVSNTLLAPAIALYRSIGFEVVHEGPHPEYRRGNIVMQLSLATLV